MPSDPRIGTRIGDYRLEERIKQAGFSTVYRARDIKKGRDVALKVIAPNVAADRNLMKNVKKEVKIASRLSHENFIDVHDSLLSGPVPYIAMEYFPSRDLKSLIMNEPAQVKKNFRSLALQMAAGLSYMHARNIIHCDFKPTNVLVNSDWKVKIIDLALARIDIKSILGLKTAVWMWIPSGRKREGTLEYMAPEQVRPADKLTKRTDVYSLGAALYEMIAGRPPIVGHDPKKVMEAILNSRPEHLRQYDKTITHTFDTLVLQMLAKDRKERPRDANAALKSLSKIQIFT